MAEIRLETKPVAPLFDIDTSYDHLYLVYVDDAGNEFVIRGGPEPECLLSCNIAVEEGWIKDDSEYCRLNTDAARAERGSVVLDLDGRDAEGVWSHLVSGAQTIANAGLDYELDLVGDSSEGIRDDAIPGTGERMIQSLAMTVTTP